jgi:hypothetical protein
MTRTSSRNHAVALEEKIDTSSAAGELVFHVLGWTIFQKISYVVTEMGVPTGFVFGGELRPLFRRREARTA